MVVLRNCEPIKNICKDFKYVRVSIDTASNPSREREREEAEAEAEEHCVSPTAQHN
jgi:hypothetical protein